MIGLTVHVIENVHPLYKYDILLPMIVYRSQMVTTNPNIICQTNYKEAFKRHKCNLIKMLKM